MRLIRRPSIGLGLAMLGATLVVAPFIVGSTASAAAVVVKLSAFDLDDVAQGENCTQDGWGFDSSAGKFNSITLNAATGVGPITSIQGFQTTFFVPASGASLTALTTDSEAEINASGQNVPVFSLNYVCGSTTPPTTSSTSSSVVQTSTSIAQTSTTIVQPSSSVPTSDGPSSTEGSAEPTNTAIDAGSGGVGPTTGSSAPESDAPQLADTGLYDRMLVISGLLLVAMGSVLYLLSRPAEAR